MYTAVPPRVIPAFDTEYVWGMSSASVPYSTVGLVAVTVTTSFVTFKV